MRHPRLNRSRRLFASVGLASSLAAGSGSAVETADGWLHYGGSLGGDRLCRTFGDNPRERRASLARLGLPNRRRRIFEVPGYADRRWRQANRLHGFSTACSPWMRPRVPRSGRSTRRLAAQSRIANRFTSRGVAAWQDEDPDQGPCRSRIFLGTLDARLFALDGESGVPCADFRKGGAIDLSAGIPRYRQRDYSLTSPPTVVGDLVIVGSAIGNDPWARSEAAVRWSPRVVSCFWATSSTLRAYDGIAGNELWTGALPAGAHSTPMGYRHGGMDYVVITAGGRLIEGEGQGDYVVAFRLDEVND